MCLGLVWMSFIHLCNFDVECNEERLCEFILSLSTFDDHGKA